MNDIELLILTKKYHSGKIDTKTYLKMVKILKAKENKQGSLCMDFSISKIKSCGD